MASSARSPVAPPKSFLEELVDATSKNRGKKAREGLEEIKRECLEAARNGHHRVRVSWRFAEFEQELLSELDVLGVAHKVTARYKDLTSIEIAWPLTQAASKKRKLDGGGTGNLEMQCGVCYGTGPMKRLHPCGHLLGNCCSVDAAKTKKCPFCRQEVSAVQSVYRP